MVFDTSHTTKSAQETAQRGAELGDWIRKTAEPGARVICLYGELGSGKTTFVQGFTKGFGISSRLLSPAFIIVRRYHLERPFNFFYHLDLYRINNTEELEELGLEEIFSDPYSIAIIEWAEKLGTLLPKHRVDVRFSVLEDGKHSMSLSSSGLTRGSRFKIDI